MRVFAVDSDQSMLGKLYDAIMEAEPSAMTLRFRCAKPVLEAIAHGLAPDIVFSAIKLPDIDGFSLARHIKETAPNAKMVFVTAYKSYAVEAFRIHVDGFMVKPVDSMRIREEFKAIFPKGFEEPPKLRVRCFGNFDVFFGDKPLIFSRTQTKELLAYLVDRMGSVCTSAEIIDALWEDRKVKNPQAYLRVLTADLRDTLASVGMEAALVREHGRWAIRSDMLDCDYYRMIDGHMDAVRAFQGEYMAQYSWAEPTKARLYFTLDMLMNR